MSNPATAETLRSSARTGPTAADLVRRARALAATLVARQAETESRSFYAEDTQQAFVDAGFFRMLTPRQFGGLECELATYCRVVMALSSGCPSTGWQFNLGASHAPIVGSLFDDAVLAELFSGGEFICAATIAPQGTATRLESGDYSITGVFNYASGIPYSRHFMGHALLKTPNGSTGPVLTFVAPKALWRRRDDWVKSLGLKGSGSHSVEMTDARVPARFVVEGSDMMNASKGGAPRPRADSQSLFRHGRLLSLNVICAASMLVGMLKGALDEYGRLMQARKTVRPPVTLRYENDDYRRWMGTATGKLGMAEAALLSLCEQWTTAARQAADGPEPFSAQEDSRIACVCLEIMDTAWHALQGILWPTAGTSAAMDGEVLQRIFRDMAMARSHVVNVLADGIASAIVVRAHAIDSAIG